MEIKATAVTDEEHTIVECKQDGFRPGAADYYAARNGCSAVSHTPASRKSRWPVQNRPQTCWQKLAVRCRLVGLLGTMVFAMSVALGIARQSARA